MTKPGKGQLLTSLKEKSSNIDFITSVVNSESIGEVLKTDMVVLRNNSVEIKSIDKSLAVACLGKVIHDVFEYFNQKASSTLIEMLIVDILEMWGRWSVIEIVKAITEGRRTAGDLYGRLSAKHITQWLRDYDNRLSDEITKHHHNKSHDNLISREDVLKSYKAPKVKKQKHTAKDKAKAMTAFHSVPPGEQERREYMRGWNAEKGVTLEEWMNNFKNK